MFCSKCGSKLEERSKFCHNCGAKIGNKTQSIDDYYKSDNITDKSKTKIGTYNKIKISKEYLSKTDLKDEQQARKYLTNLRVLFWLVFICSVIIRGLGSSEDENYLNLFLLSFIAFIGLLIYFVYFCVKVLKVLRIPKINAVWCVIFAPFSWLYLYPLMADPLKIVLGIMPPPKELSDEDKIKRNKASQKYWKFFWIIFGSIFIMIFLLIFLLIFLYQ